MTPISEAPSGRWRRVVGILTDIDDTLTTGGRVGWRVFESMERLQGARIAVVPVTGRPAGWCDMIARTWPVDAVVGENGAFYFRYDGAARRMHRIYADEATVRDERMQRLGLISKEVLRRVPEARIAADQAYRISDMAIDFAEDTGPLGQAEIDRIVDIFRAHGATAKVSSIHVNAWFGEYDKLVMARRLLREFYGHDGERDVERWVFIGDSPNDAPMFAFFRDAVGVANLAKLAGQCEALPRWLTAKAGGEGFVEFAETLLAGGRS